MLMNDVPTDTLHDVEEGEPMDPETQLLFEGDHPLAGDAEVLPWVLRAGWNYTICCRIITVSYLIPEN